MKVKSFSGSFAAANCDHTDERIVYNIYIEEYYINIYSTPDISNENLFTLYILYVYAYLYINYINAKTCTF